MELWGQCLLASILANTVQHLGFLYAFTGQCCLSDEAVCHRTLHQGVFCPLSVVSHYAGRMDMPSVNVVV